MAKSPERPAPVPAQPAPPPSSTPPAEFALELRNITEGRSYLASLDLQLAEQRARFDNLARTRDSAARTLAESVARLRKLAQGGDVFAWLAEI